MAPRLHWLILDLDIYGAMIAPIAALAAIARSLATIYRAQHVPRKSHVLSIMRVCF